MRSNIQRSRFQQLLALCVIALVTCTQAFAQAQVPIGRFVERTFSDAMGDQKYFVFVPANYRADKPSPAILFLHGAGERGHDNRLQLTHGLAPFIEARAATFPFLTVFPQCEFTEGRIRDSWKADSPNGQRALRALDDARRNYNFDPQRVVLTGWSMGGYGAWSLGIAEPSRWSAVMPLAGGGDANQVGALKQTPVWAFHGAKDTLIKAEEVRSMVDALKAAGGTATYTELPDADHDICDKVYGNDGVIAWMLDPQKAPMQLGPATVKAASVVKVPFVPAVEINQAVGLRLGNEVLDALSYSIPEKISPNLLNGQLSDMYDSTTASGRQFNIQFSGISYTGHLERVATKGIGKGRILVQLGIRNVTLTIGQTFVTGARHSAHTGPIAIWIGHRYPVWFNLELAPYIENNRIRLRLIGAGIQIPPDNFSVSQPAGVSVRGLFITEEAVSSGLTSGLYQARGRIQNEVVNIAPRIVQEMESNLKLPDSSFSGSGTQSTLAKLWPLPIYPPRLQAWPEQISADENGISLVLRTVVGSTEPYEPAKPVKKVTLTDVSLAQIPTDKAMHFHLAPEIFGPLTEVLVDSKQTQVDLLDIPEPLFAKLADRATLQEIIPDLAQFGDSLQAISTLRFHRPLAVHDAEKAVSTDPPKPHEFDIPKVQLTIAIKTSAAQTEWQRCAVFDLDLSEQFRLSLQKPAHDQRVVDLDWLQAARVAGSGKFADGYTPKDKTFDSDRYVELFNKAWEAYFAGLKGMSTEMSDISIGNSKMRVNDLNWGSRVIDFRYELARIKLSNLSDQPFTYQTKSPYSAWGEPLTLKPGASHEFVIPYPLTYRRQVGSQYEVYTLPVGSHSEFRVPVAGGPPQLFAAKKPEHKQE